MFTHIQLSTLFINVIRVLFVLKIPIALFFLLVQLRFRTREDFCRRPRTHSRGLLTSS